MVVLPRGHDVLVALPTGFGKSLIYQVLAMLLERPTIVVSPLVALMADQERALKSRGVPVILLHSRLRTAERRAALERLEDGGRLVVLTTPETLESRAAASRFERARPALLCVDEAHCISEWGYDFRPSYLRLGAAVERLGNPPVLALTATATPRVQKDIAERLRLCDPRVLTAPAHRANLRLTVEVVRGAEKFRATGRRIRGLLRRKSSTRHYHCGRSARGGAQARGHPGRALPRQDAYRGTGRGPASVHATLSTSDYGCDECLRHGYRQTKYSLHPSLPRSQRAGAIRARDWTRRTRRATGALYTFLRPGRS
jgi:ATP-dependent DNA helicase RecQ